MTEIKPIIFLMQISYQQKEKKRETLLTTWCKSLKCLEIIMYTNILENLPYKNATGIGEVEVDLLSSDNYLQLSPAMPMLPCTSKPQ